MTFDQVNICKSKHVWVSATLHDYKNVFSASEIHCSPHLPKEKDAPSHYEGRDGCADHSEERNGPNVLEEVTLNTQGHTA